MNFIANFFKSLWYNTINIYVEDKDIREAYGDEYADRFKAVDPVTGKKKISAKKIFIRIIALSILLLYIFFMVRITQKGMWSGSLAD